MLYRASPVLNNVWLCWDDLNKITVKCCFTETSYMYKSQTDSTNYIVNVMAMHGSSR